MTQGRGIGFGRVRSGSGNDTHLIQTSKPQMPVPIKPVRASSLSDTGVAYTLAQQSISTDHEDGAPAVMDLDELISHKRKAFVKLEQSLLVRLTIPRGDDSIRVLCDSREIHKRGIRLILASRLDIQRGTKLDMELFIPSSDEPVLVSGKVRRVLRSSGQDVVRFLIEVEFGSLEHSAADSIAQFVQDAEHHARRGLPA